MASVINKLEDKVDASKNERDAIIDFEKNENLKGTGFIDVIFSSIQKEKVIDVSYKSFKARKANSIILHPYLLKEYRNPWFVLGRREKSDEMLTLALDRVQEIELNESIKYSKDENFKAIEYFKDVIGVTVNKTNRVQRIRLLANNENSPYILTKPLHHSQEVISTSKEGMEFAIYMHPNFELEKEILGFGDSLVVLSPKWLQKRTIRKLSRWHYIIDTFDEDIF